MNTPVTHRFVAMALSVVVTLGLFQSLSQYAGPDEARQLLVRVNAEASARS